MAPGRAVAPHEANSPHVIRVGGAAALLPLLVERGIDPEALAAEAGLSAAVFANPENVVPFAAMCRMARLAAERTGLGDVGLRACVQTGLTALGTLGYLVAHSESVERGLAALQEYLYVHDEGATSFFAREGETAVLGYRVLATGLPGAEQVTFGALAIAANVLRAICGGAFRLREVSFAYRAPADISLFRSFFAAPLRFDADRSVLAFDAAWLGAPIEGADAYLRGILVDRIHSQVASTREDAEDRIRRVVRTLVAGGRHSVDDVAAAFGMNRRTFARRLGKLGTGFRELLDDARCREAQALLQSSAVPIVDVAVRLGYSDTATFTRAFRRWSGTSPAKWRRAHAGGSLG